MTDCKYENFTVIRKGTGRVTKGGQYKTTWICKCVCGKEFEVDGQKIRRNEVYSCGCMRYKNREKYFNDLSNMEFDNFKVVRRLKPEEVERKRYNWLCECNCGRMFYGNTNKIKTGHTKSCGCLKEKDKIRIGNLNRKYHYSNRRMYAIYRAMILRCYNPNIKGFSDYGGRGIEVCEEWRSENGFDVFYEWAIQNGYEENLTIDRIDVNRNYKPSNCRWVTNLKQQNNRRNNIMLTYDGKTQSLKEWSRELNINYSAMHWRWKKYNMGIKEMIDILKQQD